MKYLQNHIIILTLTCISTYCFAQDSILDKIISVQFKGEKISESIEMLGRKMNLDFVYNSDILVDEGSIHLNFDKVSLGDVLDDILKETNISFKEINGQIYFFEEADQTNSIVEKTSIKPEQIILRGEVLDAITKEPVPFAHAFINNSTIGTYTGVLGKFALKSLKRQYEVLVSHVGYDRKRILVDPNTTNNVQILIEPSKSQLDEVVVTAKRDRSWKKYLKLFSKEFLGFSNLARKCKITNPEVLAFELKESKLSVRAEQPIIIENMATGYILTYYLESFIFDMRSMMPRYYGYCLFEKMDTSNFVVKKVWEKNRVKAYNGSLNHFVKAVLLDRMKQEGFLTKDKKLISVNHNISKKTYDINIDGEIEVSYVHDHETLDYKNWNARWKPGAPTLPSAYTEKPRKQTTVLKPLDLSIIADQNYQVLNPDRVLLKGYMGWERTAEVLPIDYLSKN